MCLRELIVSGTACLWAFRFRVSRLRVGVNCDCGAWRDNDVYFATGD